MCYILRSRKSDHGRVTLELKARLGARVRALREAKGWTQCELADFLGLSRVYISKLERGKCNPTLMVLMSLAENFCMTLSKLLEGV
jgi:transcriptional regulator with XRE-family HTH domain